jgi:hypothetical protein
MNVSSFLTEAPTVNPLQAGAINPFRLFLVKRMLDCLVESFGDRVLSVRPSPGRVAQGHGEPSSVHPSKNLVVDHGFACI